MADLNIKGRLAFVNLFEKKEFGGKAQYSCSVLVPKSSKNTINRINDAIANAIEEGREKYHWKAGIEKSSNFKLPLHDGDEKEEYDGYPGNYFLNVKNNRKPTLIDLDGMDLTPEELYSGCWANCILTAFPYDAPGGGKGISVSVQGVQKFKDDESFGAKKVTADTFTKVDFGDDEDGGFLE